MIAERFWSKVDKTEGCWNWTASADRAGRGRFKWNGRVGYAPRFSWELHYGEIPEGLYVLHECDNPACVRPDHLFLGTKGDNNTDRSRKGRNADFSGSKNPASKIDEGVAKEIIRLIKNGLGNTEISKLGFPYNAVQNIRYGRAWAQCWE